MEKPNRFRHAPLLGVHVGSEAHKHTALQFLFDKEKALLCLSCEAEDCKKGWCARIGARKSK